MGIASQPCFKLPLPLHYAQYCSDHSLGRCYTYCSVHLWQAFLLADACVRCQALGLPGYSASRGFTSHRCLEPPVRLVWADQLCLLQICALWLFFMLGLPACRCLCGFPGSQPSKLSHTRGFPSHPRFEPPLPVRLGVGRPAVLPAPMRAVAFLLGRPSFSHMSVQAAKLLAFFRAASTC